MRIAITWTFLLFSGLLQFKYVNYQQWLEASCSVYETYFYAKFGLLKINLANRDWLYCGIFVHQMNSNKLCYVRHKRNHALNI